MFDLYWKSAGGTGSEELLLKTPHNKLLSDWSPDGQYVLYQEDDPQTKTDLWMLPLAGDRKPARLLATPFNESEAALSPDGRWMAYRDFRQAKSKSRVDSPWASDTLGNMELNVPPDLETKLARAADRRGMTPERLVLEAIERAVEYDDWFLREVEKGLAQVERGEVLTHEEVGARIERRLTQARLRP